MVETKPFKTKLCVLYQRGRCERQTCTFAHGDTELRQFPGSFTDRRNSRGHDLRNKLDRRRSPLHKYSPVRDARNWRGHQRSSPLTSNQRRKYRTHEHMDGQSDFSGSFRGSDGTVDRGKDKKLTSTDSRNVLEDELKQVQYEVDVLLDQRGQLEIELEERIHEADSLSSRIKDLEAQLSEEKDNTKRVNSKIEKLIGAHVRHSRLQHELKRSQIQFEKLVEELGLDANQLGANEDNSSIIIIDEEFPQTVKLQSSAEGMEGSNLANTANRHGHRVEGSSRRHSHVHFDSEGELGNKRKDITRMQSNGSKSKRRKDALKGSAPLDKPRVLESNIVAPPTSMAAHAADNIDQTEAEDRTEVVETPDLVENDLPLPLPPLPSVSKNNYVQYECLDVKVDVDGPQELEEVDIV